jgi:uncharacterized protein YeaO (DUF488 family)
LRRWAIACIDGCVLNVAMAARRKPRLPPTDENDVPGGYSSPACYLHELPQLAEPGTRGVEIKRIYEVPDAADGLRVLIDRLWPRGISRRRAALDAWLVDLAPSTALRTWFHHHLDRWPEFGRRYRTELRSQAPLLQQLRQRARRQRVTLLYGARDPRVNHAVVLRDVLRRSSAAKRQRAKT